MIWTRALLRLAVLGTMVTPLAAWADDAGAGNSAAMRSYMYIKEDSDRFVGEGVAELKEFGGDALRAAAVAKERARGDLASNVRLQIRSETTEKLEFKDGKVSEDIKSETNSRSDVALENIKYMEFKNFPDPGKVTVLASVTKEDYRRQMAGKKTKVYLPENGISFNFGGLFLNSIQSGLDLNQWQYGSYRVKHFGLYSSASDGHQPVIFGLSLIWQRWVAELNFSDVEVISNPQFQDQGPSVPIPTVQPTDLKLFLVSFGYDWTPYAWKLQPYVPLRIDYDYWVISPKSTSTLALSAGLGLRYWVNDSVALQFVGRWHQGLVDGKIPEPVGGSGGELTASLLLSTF